MSNLEFHKNVGDKTCYVTINGKYDASYTEPFLITALLNQSSIIPQLDCEKEAIELVACGNDFFVYGAYLFEIPFEKYEEVFAFIFADEEKGFHAWMCYHEKMAPVKPENYFEDSLWNVTEKGEVIYKGEYGSLLPADVKGAPIEKGDYYGQ